MEHPHAHGAGKDHILLLFFSLIELLRPSSSTTEFLFSPTKRAAVVPPLPFLRSTCYLCFAFQDRPGKPVFFFFNNLRTAKEELQEVTYSFLFTIEVEFSPGF